MNRMYGQLLNDMETLACQLADRVPQPQLMNVGSMRAYRYFEKTIYQAIVQKLARMVSTLDAAYLLLSHGFVQEQAALQRILGEIQEDILFLAVGAIRGEHEDSLHCQYLAAFFQEEFDTGTAIQSTQKRPMIPRRKIHAYLSRYGFSPFDPSSGKELLRTLSKAYSGYVHAASPHIMDMYEGDPGRFHMRGLKHGPIYDAHKDDLWNYFYRGISASALAAKSFGDELLFEKYHDRLRELEQLSGKSYAPQ